MDLLFSASILASFLAGMVALFAPCCITVLLPAYLASAFREKKNMLKMTFVFFAGIAAVLVPIGMGAAALAEFFRDFHKEMYLLGGAFMLVLAVFSVYGKGLSFIPMPKKIVPNMKAFNARSVFILGIFSGAATSCCAPVLAGAMTLAVLSGVFWKALIVTFAYVFGMTLPLFLAAYFYDKYKIEQSRLVQGKIIEKEIFGKTMRVHSTNLLAGAVFALMGAALIAIALSTGTGFWAPEYQTHIGESLTLWSQNIFDLLSQIPDVLWGILLASAFLFFIWKLQMNNTRD